jgi:RNA polymerase sigma-70 factor (ECF subfamily)
MSDDGPKSHTPDAKAAAGKARRPGQDSAEQPAQQADPEWLRAALDRYEGPLIRYAARITGDLDRARDVVQETFLRLCSEDQAVIDGRVPQWLFTICRSRALDVRRKEGRMTPLTETQATARESSDRGPAEAAEIGEASSHVRGRLATLPDDQQEVIRLRFQSGLSYKQIAAVTGLTVSNVGYLIHTAIKTIRSAMNAHGETK